MVDVEKAIAIGMFSQEFAGRIQSVGNSSLSGGLQYLGDADGERRMKKLAEKSQEIGLSSDKDFNEIYMDAMLFGEE